MRKSSHPKYKDRAPTISSDTPFSVVPMAAFSDRDLSMLDLAVLGVLFSFKSKDSDLVFPSRRVIAEKVCSSKEQVSKITAKLEALGWLEKEDNTGAFSRSCRYFLRIPFNRINADREARGLAALPRTKEEVRKANRDEAEWIADMMPGMEGNGWIPSHEKQSLEQFREARKHESAETRGCGKPH